MWDIYRAIFKKNFLTKLNFKLLSVVFFVSLLTLDSDCYVGRDEITTLLPDFQ